MRREGLIDRTKKRRFYKRKEEAICSWGEAIFGAPLGPAFQVFDGALFSVLFYACWPLWGAGFFLAPLGRHLFFSVLFWCHYPSPNRNDC